MGIFLRNVHLVEVNEFYMELMVTVRQIALCIILTRAGLILDPTAMKALGFFILRLAAVPAIVEMVVITFIGHYFMGMPWIWGVMAGAIVSALSPAIVVPCLFDLQERGYGIDKNICTVLIAAASLDNVLAITIYGVVRNLLFNNGECQKIWETRPCCNFFFKFFRRRFDFENYNGSSWDFNWNYLRDYLGIYTSLYTRFEK